MKIKHVLLVALMALGLSLALVGVAAPAIAGALPGGVTSDRAVRSAVMPETVIAGRKPGIISGNTAGLTAPAIAGRPAGASGMNF